MGFYQNKVKSYSKFVKFNKKTMVAAQQKIIELKEKHLAQMKEDYRISTRYHLEFANDNDEYVIALAEKELMFLKTLDTVEFYQHLINTENFEMIQILNEAAEKSNEYSQNIEKAVKSGAKTNNKIVGGIANRKIEKNTSLLNAENLTINFTAESIAEWKGLIPDDQIIYLVGRCEIEGKHKFDKTEFNA